MFQNDNSVMILGIAFPLTIPSIMTDMFRERGIQGADIHEKSCSYCYRILRYACSA
ncbi:MAG: hypothetical protein HUJ74_02160 [Lachnospiraceae bacterium]|nr:hypothetical protein [Lachnospiraceae bacterium]